MDDTASFIRWLLGPDGGAPLNAGQMLLRAAVVYFVALVLLRVGKRRFLGRSTPFDILIGIIIGSVVSRAITGNAPFLPTLVAAAGLVFIHWLLAALTFRSRRLGALVKGDSPVLVREGEVQWDAMRRSAITRLDLEEALRTRGHRADPAEVTEARLERSGDISIIKRSQQTPNPPGAPAPPPGTTPPKPPQTPPPRGFP